jgi:hypothetical protein
MEMNEDKMLQDLNRLKMALLAVIHVELEAAIQKPVGMLEFMLDTEAEMVKTAKAEGLNIQTCPELLEIRRLLVAAKDLVPKIS